MTPLAMHEQAQREIADIYAYLTLHNPPVAVKFLEELKRHIDVIAQFPTIGSLWQSAHPSIREVHFLPLSKPFDRYLLFYRHEKMRVVILNVLHSRRDLHPLIQPSASMTKVPHTE